MHRTGRTAIRRLWLALSIAVMLGTIAPPAAQASGPTNVLLDVPYRRQHDGTVWGSSNCGPASIAMVLAAYGHPVSNKAIRDRANRILGIADPDGGTRLQDLAQIVRERGLVPVGLYQGNRFRRWTLDDVRREVLAGHPVIPQVYYPLLPNHLGFPEPTDHFVVIVGLSGDGFVFNDPANRFREYRRLMTPEEFGAWAARDGKAYRHWISAADLTRAWRASQYPFAAFAVAPGAAGRALLPSAS